MARKLLTNRQWKLICPLLPGKPTDPGRTGADNRRTIEGILWVMRTGAPVARPAALLRQLEYSPSPIPPVGQSRRVRPHLRGKPRETQPDERSG